jgi:protein-disulfide isomerase
MSDFYYLVDIQSSESEPVVQLASMSAAPMPSAPGFDKTKLILPVSILIAAVLISGALLYTRGAAPSGGGNPTAVVPGTKVNLDLNGAPSMGNANAKVTIVEYADFQCPYCERYFKNNEASIVSSYVNTGKARFVWKDYAFLGQESLWAAEAARCANDQGKFWPYHDYLYNHQGAENSGAFSKANLKKFAGALGLNASQFNSCLDSDKYLSAVQAETQAGSGVGVSGTPATFVNGILVSDASGNSVGAAPFATFQAVIDKALSK